MPAHADDAASLRTQLTLFVQPPDSEHLEALRHRLDPVQAARIPAHVTLCREDEIAALAVDTLLADPAARLHHAHLTLAHPRNPRAAGNNDPALAASPPALQLCFSQVALIQQTGAQPWRRLWQAPLRGQGW
jgi:hypothetical protein